MQIDTTNLDNFSNNLKDTSQKLHHINDVIPKLQQEITAKLPNVTIAAASNDANILNVRDSPFNTQQKQLQKLIQSTRIIPISMVRRTRQPKQNNSRDNNKETGNKKEHTNNIGFVIADELFDVLIHMKR